jgi:NAD(P)-dependent dehydrogenase (short-subunit alcohol dehydrogenase family)
VDERVAVVTGGAGAIGAAIVDELRRSFARVEVLDRAQCDLADAGAVRHAAAAIGRADVLVHAAAAFDLAELHELELETLRRVLAVNVESVVLLAQAFTPGMAQRGWGRIINIVSDTIWSPPSPAMLAYVTSKSALVGLTRTLAAALGRDGITVNAVAPGLTDTPAARRDVPESEFEAVVRRQALPRQLTPDDVGGTVAFLCTDGAQAITGQTLCVDGGLIFR